MIQLRETSFDYVLAPRVTSRHNTMIMLLISLATILVTALPGSASASSDVGQNGNLGYSHLLLFSTTSLNSPLR